MYCFRAKVEKDMRSGTCWHLMKAHTELTKQMSDERARHKQELEDATRRAKTAGKMHDDVWAARMDDQERAEERLHTETTKMLKWHQRYEEQKAKSVQQTELIRQLKSELAAANAKLAATEAVTGATKRQRNETDALVRDSKSRRLPPPLRQ